jgi:hypothetical protein
MASAHNFEAILAQWKPCLGSDVMFQQVILILKKAFTHDSVTIAPRDPTEAPYNDYASSLR